MKRCCIFVFVIVLLLLTGCQQYNEYEYNETYLRLSEPYGAEFLFNGNVLQAVVNGHTYEFENTIEEKDRNIFITNQEKLSDFLGKQGVSTQGLIFRVLKNYPNRTESENRVGYYSTTTELGWEQVLTTLQLCYGDYTNYGYLYALANHVAGQLKGDKEETSALSETIFRDDPSLLNLVFPCFSEKYSDAQTVKSSKALSVKLLAQTQNIWSEADFLKQREAYAQSQEIDFAPTYMTFAYNGASCPLKLTNQHMEVFFDHTFIASNEFLDSHIPVDYTHGVKGLVHTFTWLDEQLGELCHRLGADMQERLSVQMMAELPQGYYSPYFKTGGLYTVHGEEIKIFATTVTVLAHEYTHHVYKTLCGPDDPGYQQWYNECVAYYFTLGHQYEYRVNVIKYKDPSYADRIKETLGEPYDEPSDYIKFLRVVWRAENENYLYSLKTTHDLCCAFGEYFVRTYGEKNFVNSMLHSSKVKELTGKTMDQIVNDWVEDMRDPAKDELLQCG